jgi:hypothetical protein
LQNFNILQGAYMAKKYKTMKKILFLLLFTFSLGCINAQTIETNYRKIGDKGVYEKWWSKFTLSDSGYLVIENIITKRLKIIEMTDPVKEDGTTIYEFTCKENDQITHKFTIVFPDTLENNLIMVIDRMSVGKREMPVSIYVSEKF